MPVPSQIQPLNMPAVGRSAVEHYVAAWQKLIPQDLQWVLLKLQAALSTSTTSDDDEYTIPGDYDFIGLQVAGSLRLTALASEPVGVNGPLGQFTTVTERMLIKAQNCVVGITTKDRKYNVTENEDPTLADFISPPFGFGGPKLILPEAPMIIPSSWVLKATFTLQDTASATVGASTVYGVVIAGVLIPRVRNGR